MPDIPPPHLSERTALAVEIARAAGGIMRRHLAQAVPPAATMKGPQDYLTLADREVEAMIRARVAERFPEDTVLGEEGGGEVSAATWVVDPIDGTANFAHGVEHFAVSIGFAAEGKPALGIVYDPSLDLLYSAEAGGGAFLNGRAIHVSAVESVEKATLEIGCWRRRPPPSNYTRVVERALAAGAGFRWTGSAALGLADVARGASEAFYGLHLQPWDALAGILLVSEAGGRVSDFLAHGGLRHGNALLASNRALFAPLSALLLPS